MKNRNILLTISFNITDYHHASIENLPFDSEKEINFLKNLGDKYLHLPQLISMRKTFKAMPDMDPSRYRPASESLLRRFVSKGWFSIFPLVDINNYISLRTRIPFGIYSLDKIQTDTIIYRIGQSNESYCTLSGQIKSAEGKLVLCDRLGVIGSPVTDSNRANVDPLTQNILLIGYLPFYVTRNEVNSLKETIHSIIFKTLNVNAFLVSEILKNHTTD